MSKHTYSIDRTVAKALFVVAALLFSTACRTTSQAPPPSTVETLSEKLLVIGHRGAAGLAPENTLSAFSKAMQIGVDAVEMDVQLTADGKVVVYHDSALNADITRTAEGRWLDGPGPAIKDLTLAKLKTYDVGRSKPGSQYSLRFPQQQPVDGERVPTLSEVISLLRTTHDDRTQLCIEIKSYLDVFGLTHSPETIAEAVVDVLRQENFAERAVIVSFDWRSLIHVNKIAPDIPTAYTSALLSEFDTIQEGKPGKSLWIAGPAVEFGDLVPVAIKTAGGHYWSSYYRDITLSLVEEAHRLGIKVLAWTPNSPDEMITLTKMGVDGIITDRPDILKAILREQ
jgi:glycerophosphoryl diester phosphodiesterase